MSFSVNVNEAKKLLITESQGNLTVEEMVGLNEKIELAKRKFKKGEYKLLNKTTDFMILTPEANEVLKEINGKFDYFSKVASVVGSAVLKMQTKRTGNEAGVGNRRIFDSEEVAMKWLME